MCIIWHCVSRVSEQFIMAYTVLQKAGQRARIPQIIMSEGLPRCAEGFFFDHLTLTSNLLEISEESPSVTVNHPSTPPPHAIPGAHIKMFKKPQKQTTGRWGVATGSWWSGRNEKLFLWCLINKSDGGPSSEKTNIYNQMNWEKQNKEGRIH